MIRYGLPRRTMVLGETLDWSRDWSSELEDDEVITSSVWAMPASLIAGMARVSGPYTTQWITAAALGAHLVENTIQTSGPYGARTFKRTMVIHVVEHK